MSAWRAFVWMDRYLDRAEWGPRFLQNESIATLVVTSLWRGAELGHYQLGAFAIMANHAHVLLLPRVTPSRLLQSLKGYTAYQANRCWREPVSRSGSGNLTTTGSETKKSGAALRPILRTIR